MLFRSHLFSFLRLDFRRKVVDFESLFLASPRHRISSLSLFQMSSADRVAVLARHLAAGGRGEERSSLEASPTASRSSALSLPPIDAAAMEAALDVDPAKRAMRKQVYSLFENRPDLMPACVEGMRKGELEQDESVRREEARGQREQRKKKGRLSWKAWGTSPSSPSTICCLRFSMILASLCSATPLGRCFVSARHRRHRPRGEN